MNDMPTNLALALMAMFVLSGVVWMAESECRDPAFASLIRRFLGLRAHHKCIIALVLVMFCQRGGGKSGMTNSAPEQPSAPSGQGQDAALTEPGSGGGTGTVSVAEGTAQGGAATNAAPAQGATAPGTGTAAVETLPGSGTVIVAIGDLADGGARAGLGLNLPEAGQSSEPQRLTSNQYAAGFALVTQTVSDTSSWLAMPANAVVHDAWACYGAARDSFWLPATDWGFVLGTNAVEGALVSSSGTLSFWRPKGSPRASGMPDGTGISFLAPLQGQFGIVPPGGRFWHALTDSNSVLFTWQDVYAGRDTNSPVSFQAELFWNGDFTYRYAFPSNSSILTPNSSLTNFVVGAQHSGGGETYALDDTNLLVNGLELRWRAFGILDPNVDDHDGDGLSTYDEVMVYGTDPRLPDSDFDGLSDAVEVAEGPDKYYYATNPDTDHDGLADGIDPHPRVWDDADADADGDGYPLWQELFYGTSDAVGGDVALLFGPDGRSVDFTVSGSVPPVAVLTVGGFPVPLAGRTAFSLKFAPDKVCNLRLAGAPGVSVAVASQDCVALSGATGGLAPGGGSGPGTASLAFPVVRLGNNDVICLHEGETAITARVTANLPGRYVWSANEIPMDGEGSGIGQAGVPSGRLSVSFYPDGGVPSGDTTASLSGGGGAARYRSRSLASTGSGSPCSCGVAFSRCKRGSYCDHGRPWGLCWICQNPYYWCGLHEEFKIQCACLTVDNFFAGGMLSADGLQAFCVGSSEDTGEPWLQICCHCPEHDHWWIIEPKCNTIREVSPQLTLYRDSDGGDGVSEGEVLEGPTLLYAQGGELSKHFSDAYASFSEKSHPEKKDWVSACFTFAEIGLEPDTEVPNESGSYLIRGGVGCAAGVSVVTDSDLQEGSVSLSSGGGGLFFSESQGAQASSALTDMAIDPPKDMKGPRTFYLGATNGGLHTLSYALLDPDYTVCCATNISVEVVLAKLVTNAYYAAYGSADPLEVGLTPESHDPGGYTLYIDGTMYHYRALPPFQVDVSGLSAGEHTLTATPYTFPDLAVSATINVVKVEFIKMSETTNPANCIFNATPKDDPPEIPRNMLYVVESPADSMYHVTVEVNDQPASARSKLMYAVYAGGSKLPTGEGFSPLSGPINITFNHPMVSSALVTDFEIKFGYDLNGNNSLDTNEILSPLEVKNATGDVIGSPQIRGASDVRYAAALGVVATGTIDFLVPHASKLLQIFYDGGPGGLPVDKQPTTSGTANFNCFSGSFSEWLTHNSGAAFSSGGEATIPYHQWNIATSLANLVGESYQIKDAAESYYNTTVESVVEAYFLTNPVGHVAAFPSSPTEYYNVPHIHESPGWVPETTVTFDEPMQINGVNDDVNGTIGRGRLLYHKAKFIVEKKAFMGVEWLEVIQANYMGEVDDLYDFNQEAGGPAGESAIVQIGYGAGAYGRSAGVIYRSQIVFDVLVDDPF